MTEHRVSVCWSNRKVAGDMNVPGHDGCRFRGLYLLTPAAIDTSFHLYGYWMSMKHEFVAIIR